MIETPSIDLWSISFELVLAVCAIVVLLVGIMPFSWARPLAILTAFGGMAGAAAMAVAQYGTPRTNEFAGQIDADPAANLIRLLAASAGLVAVVTSAWSRPRDGRDAEHFSLLLLAVCGMGFFAAAGSLMSLFVGLELFSIALYVLCALEANRASSLEAGFKYLVIGGLGSALFLYGAAMVYGATGSFDLTQIGAAQERGALLLLGGGLIVAALGFKASAAPLHWWTPDVYDGSPTSVTGFMATATKVVAFLAMVRVLTVAFAGEAASWESIIAGLAVVSIVVGNLGALAQERLKRMLAYSSIAQAGYLLIGVVAWNTGFGLVPLLYALTVYVAMTLGAFTLVQLRERRTDVPVTYATIAGTGWGETDAGEDELAPAWAVLGGVAMIVVMLSLAGIPPTGGFFAKFGIFQAAVAAGYGWLAVIGVVGSAVSLAYYLRVLVAMYMLPARRDRDAEPAPGVVDRVGGALRGASVGEGALPTESAVLLPDVRGRRPILAAVGILMAIVTLGLGIVPDAALDELERATMVDSAAQQASAEG